MTNGAGILDSEVVIVGGGPFGLMLAIELGRRDISTALYDAKNGTAYNPQANATQARTMEYFRRLGIADEIRGLGMPADYPTDIAYFTRYGHHELGRFGLPASNKANAHFLHSFSAFLAAAFSLKGYQFFVGSCCKAHTIFWIVSPSWSIIKFVRSGRVRMDSL